LPSAFGQTLFARTSSGCLVNLCASTALATLRLQHSPMKPGLYDLLLV
jgi:hypothetical protein